MSTYKNNYITELRIGPTNGKGRGVYAERYFRVGELVERAPVLVLPFNDLRNLEKTIVGKYWFRWIGDSRALALGYGSLYNHSYQPNVACQPNFIDNAIEYIAIKPILKGEEIVFNYSGLTETPVPFETV